MVTEEENTLFNFSLLPVPNSNVMKRDIAADNDPDNIENIAPTPPTTLYILLSYPVDTPVLKVTASVHGRASPRTGGYHIVSVSENGFA